jgi:uncharacterized membrane protein HdeD (DUF308 family)
MFETIGDRAHRKTGPSIALSLLMIVAGVLAIGLPLVAGFAVETLAGWLLLVSGLLHLGFAWHRSGAGGVLWEILLGILYGWIGIYLLLHPVAGLVSLTLAIAFYLLLEGLLELTLWFQLRHSAGSGWLLLDGVVTAVLAVMIWSTWPSSATWVIGTLVGISMFLSGITRLMLSIAVRRALV